jgi:hypothetical protein
MFRFNNTGLAAKLEDLFKQEGFIASGPYIPDTCRDCRTAYRLTDEGRQHKEKIRPFIEPKDLELFDRI